MTATRRAFLKGLKGSLALVWVGTAARGANEQPADADGRVPLAIATGEGTVTFQVEVAGTPEAKARGLMFQESLAEDHGMLFLFDPPANIAMWMKNTLIPLDMLFIDANGRIVKIAARTEPHSTVAITAGQPVRAVLEINGGASQRFGIREGDTVIQPTFVPAAER